MAKSFTFPARGGWEQIFSAGDFFDNGVTPTSV
jgi:hypothetical protein